MTSFAELTSGKKLLRTRTIEAGDLAVEVRELSASELVAIQAEAQAHDTEDGEANATSICRVVLQAMVDAPDVITNEHIDGLMDVVSFETINELFKQILGVDDNEDAVKN